MFYFYSLCTFWLSPGGIWDPGCRRTGRVLAPIDHKLFFSPLSPPNVDGVADLRRPRWSPVRTDCCRTPNSSVNKILFLHAGKYLMFLLHECKKILCTCARKFKAHVFYVLYVFSLLFLMILSQQCPPMSWLSVNQPGCLSVSLYLPPVLTFPTGPTIQKRNSSQFCSMLSTFD